MCCLALLGLRQSPLTDQFSVGVVRLCRSPLFALSPSACYSTLWAQLARGFPHR